MIKKSIVAFAATATLLSAVPTGGLFSPIQAEAAQSKQQQFFESYGPIASKVAGENNLYASVMLAQMALESGYGKSGLSRSPINNLFGIKGSYNGLSISVATKEDDGNGNLYEIIDKFRKYPSAEASMNDYVRLLNSNKVYVGVRKSETSSYQDATQRLQGTYATDTKYASKLNHIIKSYGLTKYDTPQDIVVGENGTPVSDAHVEVMSNTHFKTHVVKKGDTIDTLAKQYGVDVSYLKSINKLSTGAIFLGQELKVKEVDYYPFFNYVVSKNETLNSIATKYDTTSEEIMKMNNMTTDVIVAGKVIKIPEPIVFKEYKILKGDTLNKISEKFQTPLSILMKDNNLYSDLIFAGSLLKVRDESKSE